jgi:hypothetical protein
MLIREQTSVRLISRGGHDWAKHFPLIVAAALKLRQEPFAIDGEAVVLRPEGISDALQECDLDIAAPMLRLATPVFQLHFNWSN